MRRCCGGVVRVTRIGSPDEEVTAAVARVDNDSDKKKISQLRQNRSCSRTLIAHGGLALVLDVMIL